MDVAGYTTDMVKVIDGGSPQVETVPCLFSMDIRRHDNFAIGITWPAAKYEALVSLLRLEGRWHRMEIKKGPRIRGDYSYAGRAVIVIYSTSRR